MKLSANSLLTHLSLSLIKKKKRKTNLSAIRAVLPTELYSDFLDKVYQYPAKLTKVVGTTPKSLPQIDDSPNLQFLSVENELRWAKTIILKNSVSINCSVNLANSFSSAFLNSDYSEAISILDKIEKDAGYSIWLIKTKIGFLQFSGGLESQKRYSQYIKDETDNGSLAAYISYWVSIRNEETVTIARFTKNFEGSIENHSQFFENQHLKYFRYHILPGDSYDVEDLARILCIEFTKSLTDFYEAFVSLSRAIVLSDDEAIRSQLKFTLLRICKEVNDFRLHQILQLLMQSAEPTNIFDGFNHVHNNYLDGNYENSLIDFKPIFHRDPSHPLSLILGSLLVSVIDGANIMQPDDSPTILAHEIISRLGNIIRYGFGRASNDVNQMQKLAFNFTLFPWASAIKIVLFQEESLFSIQAPSRFDDVLKVPGFHAYFLEMIEGSSLYASYAILCADNSEYDNTLLQRTTPAPGSIDSSSKLLTATLAAFEAEDFELSLSLAEKLTICRESNFARRGHGLIAISYVKQQNYNRACLSIANSYLQDENQFLLLPISEFVNHVVSNSQSWRSVCNLVDLAIILDAYCKHVSGDFEAFRRYAYEDFLLTNGMNRPSELVGCVSKFNKEKVVYYLRHICIEVNMDTSIVFDGAKDVASERLIICKLLCELDPENYTIYQQEIKELIRSQVISNRIQEIDESRIFIDLPGIKNWAMRELSESYSRYVSYLRHGIESEVITERRDEKQRAQAFVASGWKAMNVPSNEVHALLQYIVLEIRDKYISVDFGLDRFLSTRIRHGLLENQLRRPMQAHNLITKRVTKDGPYLPNIFWIDQLHSNAHVIAELDKAFAIFSESYDSMIGRLNNELIQIKSDKKPNGFFNFSIQDEFIEVIAQTITEDAVFEDVIDKILQKFEANLQLNLVFVREELNTKVKREGRELINTLQINVDRLSNEVNLSNLSSAISQGRTDLQATFNRVIEWFIPSSTGSSTPYTVEDLVNVAEAIIKDGTPGFSVNMKPTASDIDFLMQGSLPIFVDVLSNIFDNVVKRSGLVIPIAEVHYSMDSIGEELRILNISVENDLGENIDMDTLQTELSRKKRILESGNYNQYLAKDQNSGLFKIRRSIDDLHALGFNIKSKMDFGLSQNRYFISISIPYRIFQLELDEAESSILYKDENFTS